MEETVVISGNDITEIIDEAKKSTNKKLIIGPGIIKQRDSFFATKCGVLKFRENPPVFWIDYHQKRYIPVRGERIVGIVVQKGGMSVKVDIGTNENAVLSLLAFEGATKRNKPIIQVGDLVFAQVLGVNQNSETELVCVTSKGKRNGMGVLPAEGFMIDVPINVCRRLLAPECRLLKNLGTKFKYEIAIGMNGRIWVRATSHQATTFICNTLAEIEYLNDDEIQKRTDSILDEFVV
ncbi:exosome complex component RRP40-like protein, partial [Dinothrombium tinctorium]